MFEEKELLLLRIFLTDKDKYKGKAVYNLLVEEFLKNDLAGATVFHGIAGYGNKKIIHSAGILDVSDALPVVIEVCDTDEKITKALEITKEIFLKAKIGGFLTYEKVKVLLFKEEV